MSGFSSFVSFSLPVLLSLLLVGCAPEGLEFSKSNISEGAAVVSSGSRETLPPKLEAAKPAITGDTFSPEAVVPTQLTQIDESILVEQLPTDSMSPEVDVPISGEEQMIVDERPDNTLVNESIDSVMVPGGVGSTGEEASTEVSPHIDGTEYVEEMVVVDPEPIDKSCAPGYTWHPI